MASAAEGEAVEETQGWLKRVWANWRKKPGNARPELGQFEAYLLSPQYGMVKFEAQREIHQAAELWDEYQELVNERCIEFGDAALAEAVGGAWLLRTRCMSHSAPEEGRCRVRLRKASGMLATAVQMVRFLVS